MYERTYADARSSRPASGVVPCAAAGTALTTSTIVKADAIFMAT
jgi:hypothetical protein